MSKLQKTILIGTIFLFLPSFVLADELLEERDFFIKPDYDLEKREEITGILQRITDELYFYLEKEWWESLDIEKRKEINTSLSDLSSEFKNTIYPVLTSNYGSEWKPGIDKTEKITILIYSIIEGVSGYFNPGDEYPKAQVSSSNEREMVYLNSEYITNSLNKAFLAHEFTHLITFNQKDKTYGVAEETWLNEARAEYAPTLLDYDDEYQGSNLQKRVRNFLQNTQDSLTEWKNEIADYGALNLFTQYLVDHYGKKILIDSLHSNKTGIASLNYALEKNGFSEDFSQIFTDWTIAIFVNDCEINPKYCYLNDNLEYFKVTPFVYYLPTTGESTLNVGYLTKEWAGNWQKIIGGKESLKLEFHRSSKVNFKIPYIIEDADGVLSVNFLELDQEGKGTIYTEDEKVVSLTIIPSVQEKIADFEENEISYHFYWSASSEDSENEKEELIKQLEERIKELRAEIAIIQAKIQAILVEKGLYQNFENNLYYGMKDNAEVRCLQEFLKNQEAEIYPEGLVTGNFFSLTEKAVIRFQEKYREEILQPLNLEEGTGFFGLKSREKANQLIHK